MTADLPPRSWWLREAMPSEPEATVLDGVRHADVCIVGGGFTGLWTATNAAQVGAWEGTIAAIERHGEQPFAAIDKEELAARTTERRTTAGSRLARAAVDSL
jgi:NADPH-dependent 2,4-dienoyl-CoA reductase/sulfur reductase-like enzyme